MRGLWDWAMEGNNLEWFLFAVGAVSLYFIYAFGKSAAARKDKIPPSGILDYYLNLRYYLRKPTSEGYREYKQINLFAAFQSNRKAKEERNEWQSHSQATSNWDDEDNWDD